MKNSLIYIVLMLAHFSANAAGVDLSCSPTQPACNNCPEYQTLFPVETFSENTGALDIEADESQILDEKYLLSGNVEVNSESLYLSAGDVEVSAANSSLLATGNVKFQDESYLITSDLLSASREEDNLIAKATNANYQDYSAGLRGANGYTEYIEKTPTTVVLTNSTYSLCPVNKNDWLIDADQIELNLVKNRGLAENATVKFYGVPIFYTPRYSWVLSGRGSGFLTPDYSTYNEPGQVDDAYRLRVPYYFNLAPDRDLLVALTYMSSRNFIYEGKYRQLIAPKIAPNKKDSIWTIETKYLPEDKITGLQRWLVNFTEELDISDKTHLSAQLYRVSDSKYFKEIEQTNTSDKTLESFLKLSYEDDAENFSASILTENEQVVNDGTSTYTKALEGTISKTFNTKQMPVKIDLVSTKFDHKTSSKVSGTRTHGDIGISRSLNINYPKVTPRASVAITSYSLNNSSNINRTIFGTGLDIDFTRIKPSSIYGYKVNHRISPLITYNYRAKKVQGNIPIFDSEDKFDDIISFTDLTSGERYTGLDRITNANDITLSLESSYRNIDALKDDKDLLSLKIAQSFYADDEVVSDTANINYEARKSYSDIAASIDISINKFSLGSSAQYSPDKSKIVKKENSLSYNPSSRKFISMTFSDEGTSDTEKFYGAYPLTDSIHIFGGVVNSTSSSVTDTETTGLAFESCCWAFRLAHFKEDNSNGGNNYSTGMELVLTGLGSTSSPLKKKIENKIPGYFANLR
ncbi:LPS assembly protein LptD [Candidatus Pseudothioglobus singularis]|nr:LPS assembly protein LptD [Candidatus Pseudothioglobus singularis]